MSQMKNIAIPVLLLVMGLLVLNGCSDPNTNAVFDQEKGTHPDGWIPSGHAVAAKADGNICAECHGADLSGGMAGVSCTTCHIGGPMSIHPTDWGQDILNMHGPYATTNGTTACSNAACHGTDLKGVKDSGPSCTSCHGPGGGHPEEWNNDALTNHRWYAVYNGTTLCTSCHGADLKGGAGPSCESCHSPIPSEANCSGCHHFPPSGTASPDIAGKHTKHKALPYAGDCSICHQGHTHDGTVQLTFDSRFNAKSGTAAWNGLWAPLPPPGSWVPNTLNCSKVSCHGGQTTPDWSSGTIDITTQCTSCHAYGTAEGTPEYNSFWSGKHDYHVNTLKKACTDCHDPAKLDESSNHFKYLDTSVMEGPASATIKDSFNYNAGSCLPSCHGTRNW